MVNQQYKGPKARDLINQLVDEDVTEMKMFEFKTGCQIIWSDRHFYLSQVTQVKMGLKFYCNIDDTEKFGMVY